MLYEVITISSGVDTDHDGKLDSAETWRYNDTYTVQQSDINDNGGGDGDIDNTATVSSDDLGDLSDSAAVPVTQSPSLEILKSLTVITSYSIHYTKLYDGSSAVSRRAWRTPTS